MVQTIAPAGRGGKHEATRSLALHTIATTLAAAATGAALGGFGALLRAPWGTAGAVLVIAVALTYFARDALHAPIPLPQLRRQVPEWWRSFFSPGTAALLYGIGLGVGFATYSGFGTFAVVTVTAVASGSPGIGAVLVAPFGLARGLGVALARSWQGDDVGDLRLERLAVSAWPRRINALASIAVGTVALTFLGA